MIPCFINTQTYKIINIDQYQSNIYINNKHRHSLKQRHKQQNNIIKMDEQLTAYQPTYSNTNTNHDDMDTYLANKYNIKPRAIGNHGSTLPVSARRQDEQFFEYVRNKKYKQAYVLGQNILSRRNSSAVGNFCEYILKNILHQQEGQQSEEEEQSQQQQQEEDGQGEEDDQDQDSSQSSSSSQQQSQQDQGKLNNSCQQKKIKQKHNQRTSQGKQQALQKQEQNQQKQQTKAGTNFVHMKRQSIAELISNSTNNNKNNDSIKVCHSSSKIATNLIRTAQKQSSLEAKICMSQVNTCREDGKDTIDHDNDNNSNNNNNNKVRVNYRSIINLRLIENNNNNNNKIGVQPRYHILQHKLSLTHTNTNTNPNKNTNTNTNSTKILVKLPQIKSDINPTHNHNMNNNKTLSNTINNTNINSQKALITSSNNNNTNIRSYDASQQNKQNNRRNSNNNGQKTKTNSSSYLTRNLCKNNNKNSDYNINGNKLQIQRQTSIKYQP